MTKRLVLLMAVAMLLSSAAPTYATNWGDWGGGWDIDWNTDWWPKDDEPRDKPECDWDDWFDDISWTRSERENNWGDHNWWENKDDWNLPSHDEIKEWLENHDWKDWKGGEWHCKPHEDPIPEPATAGLAFMSVGALALATRRRRK